MKNSGKRVVNQAKKLEWYHTRYVGVRYYKHSTRKHAGRPDRNYSIRYRSIKRKKTDEMLGWASAGWTEQKANEIRTELIKKNIIW